LPLNIVWTALARSRLREIRDYIAIDDPGAAERIATRIVAVVEVLAVYPHIGRVGTRPRTRELLIGGTPYIVVYRPQRKRIVISTIWHAAQSRKPR
jgi:toxin ParE1/3/4